MERRTSNSQFIRHRTSIHTPPRRGILSLLALAICAVMSSAATFGTVPSLAAAGDAYVSGFKVKEQKDGVGPFDKDDDAGNDSSDENLIVRSFDDINYTLEFTTALTDVSHPADGGTSIDVKFTLPTSPDNATWNMQAMNWIVDGKVTYFYSDGSSSDKWDKAKSVTRQVLTGKRNLENKSTDDRVPGAAQLSAGISVHAAVSGQKIQPTFELVAAGTTQRETTVPKAVTVSAKPRFDIGTSQGVEASRNEEYVNFDTGDISIFDKGTGYDRTRIYGDAFTVALRNTSADKGLKGLELPQGDITFDLKTTAMLDGVDMTNDSTWGGMLWDYYEHNRPSPYRGKLNRIMQFGNSTTSPCWCAGVPTNNFVSMTNKGLTSGCYNGGTWKAVKDSADPSIYHITISDYAIDLDEFKFPTNSYDDEWNTSSKRYPQNVGYISVGHFQYAARFPRQVDSTKNYYLTTVVQNMRIVSKGGTVVTDEESTSNNKISNKVTLYEPGTIWKWVQYSGTSYWAAGDSVTYPGFSKDTSTYISYSGTKPLRAVDQLVKIDPVTFSAQDAGGGTIANAAKQGTSTIWWAAKPDGTGWKSDTEMNRTRVEGLVYYKTLDDLKASGKTCVGVLREIRDTEAYGQRDGFGFWVRLMTKSDAKGGYVAPCVTDLRAWNDTGEPGSVSSHRNEDGSYGVGDSNWVDGTYPDDYTKPNYAFAYDYEKAIYKDGALVGGLKGGPGWGDSCLVVTARNRVNIEVNDKVGDKTKSTYDLDAGERKVEYLVSPAVDYASENQQHTGTGAKGTATITITLPKDLTYDDGSCSKTVDSVKKNSDGTTTITVIYDGVVVGKPLEPFKLRCTIGAAGTDHDVVNNQQITARASITSDVDCRKVSKDNGTIADTSIVVVRLAALSVSKAVSPSVGNLGCSHEWTLNIGNNSQTDIDGVKMVDTMPYVGDGRGTKFTGDYHVKKIEIDFSKAPRTLGTIGEEPLRYTSDSAARTDGDDKIIAGASSASFKSLGKPTKTGTSLVWSGLDMTQEQMKALFLDIGQLAGTQYLTIKISVDASDGNGTLYPDASGKTQQPDDVYANTFTENATYQAAIVHSNVVKTTVKEENVYIRKAWDGDDMAQKFRPKSVTAHVSSNKGYSRDVILNADNQWSALIEHLKAFDGDGNQIRYSVSEPQVGDDYESNVTGNQTDGFTITNTYTYTASGEFGIHATKKISGRDFENGDSMTFHVEGTVDGGSDLKAPKLSSTNANGDITITPSSGKTAEIDFGKATVDSSYENATITYTITEKTATGHGMGKDSTARRIKVRVTDPNHNHKLTCTASGENEAVFTNTFTPDKITATIPITKTLTGRAWKDGETFSYKVTPVANGSIDSVTAESTLPQAKRNGTFTKPSSGATAASTIDGFTFPKAGTYRYRIKETVASKTNGIKYDALPILVDITVKSNASTGALTVSSVTKTRPDGTAANGFTNSYHATGEFAISTRKELTGRALKEGEFSFELLDSNDKVIDTKANAADGTVAFGKISVDEASIGKTLKYTIREKNGSLGGVTYDTKEIPVSVKVTDNGDGTLTGNVTYPSGDAGKFKNVYRATGSFKFSGTKSIEGRDFADGDSMTFHVTGYVLGNRNEKAPLPDGVDAAGNITIAPRSGSSADIPFGTVRVDLGQLDKTLVYEVTETAASGKGMLKDGQTRHIYAKVSDPNQDGKLRIVASGNTGIDFVNGFTPSPITVPLTASKRLIGRGWLPSDSFSAAITANRTPSVSKDDAFDTIRNGNKIIFTAPASGDTSTSSVNLTMSKPGTYEYSIIEDCPNGDTSKRHDGIMYSNKSITATVTVTQDMKTGKLKASAPVFTDWDGDETEAVFTNSYEAKGVFDGISVSKTLVGRKWRASDSFPFEISAGDDATKKAIADGTVTLPANRAVWVKSKGSTAKFGGISFTATGTYTFAVSEGKHNISGVDIAAPAQIRIKVTDNGDGTLKCAAIGSSSLSFTDYYGKGGEARVPITGIKTLSHSGYDKAPDIAGMYAFSVTPENGAKTDGLHDGTNDADGTVDLGELRFTMDDFDGVEPDGDGRRTLALSYIVTESGTVDGVANDENATRHLTVTATDDGSGNIAASVSGADGNAFEFVNTFSAQTEIPAIPASKIVENAPDGSDGRYLLALSPADDATGEAVKSGTLVIPGGKSYQAIEIGNGDEAAFEPMTAKKAGTYTFAVREVDPSDTDDRLAGTIDKVAGVEYDGTVYTFRYIVSENGTSTMDVTADGKNPEKAAFKNIYDAKGAIKISARKVLDGMNLRDGEFSFELLDSDGNVIDTASNDGDGNIAFKEIAYGLDGIGEHSYSIREKRGDEAGIEYDGSTIPVTVDVSDNGDGTLRVDASYDGENGEAMFTNRYIAPEVLQDSDGVMSDLVQTGVEIAGYAISIAAMTSAIGAAAIRKKRIDR